MRSNREKWNFANILHEYTLTILLKNDIFVSVSEYRIHTTLRLLSAQNT